MVSVRVANEVTASLVSLVDSLNECHQDRDVKRERERETRIPSLAFIPLFVYRMSDRRDVGADGMSSFLSFSPLSPLLSCNGLLILASDKNRLETSHRV